MFIVLKITTVNIFMNLKFLFEMKCGNLWKHEIKTKKKKFLIGVCLMKM